MNLKQWSQSTIWMAFLVSWSATAQTLESQMKENVATEHNLAEFQLVAPKLDAKDLEDLKLNEALESNPLKLREIYDDAEFIEPRTWQFTSDYKSPITVEIFQNAPSVGKQFLLVRHSGRIRYVFAISAGAQGRLTPVGTFGVIKRRWRHMSASYPSKGENNMDHVTYFKPMYGFHSTTFGVYHKLGTRDSHGCVRLARPQARAVYSLIKAYSGATIYSYSTKDPHPSEQKVIQKMLANDLNFIQKLIKERNKGDAPFTEDQYYQFLSGQMDKRQYKDLLQKWGIPRHYEVDDGRDRFPRGGLLKLP